MSDREVVERSSIDEALTAWEDKGPTSLTVALVVDALYGARSQRDALAAKVAAVSKLADEWDEHSRLFTSPIDLRVSQDWEHVVKSLRATLDASETP